MCLETQKALQYLTSTISLYHAQALTVLPLLYFTLMDHWRRPQHTETCIPVACGARCCDNYCSTGIDTHRADRRLSCGSAVFRVLHDKIMFFILYSTSSLPSVVRKISLFSCFFVFNTIILRRYITHRLQYTIILHTLLSCQYKINEKGKRHGKSLPVILGDLTGKA